MYCIIIIKNTHTINLIIRGDWVNQYASFLTFYHILYLNTHLFKFLFVSKLYDNIKILRFTLLLMSTW